MNISLELSKYIYTSKSRSDYYIYKFHFIYLLIFYNIYLILKIKQ